MQFRFLGRSGLKVSAISYGNWITHGSQVDDGAAIACVHAALDAGITTFDTADVYAGTRAEVVLGEALRGQRREGIEVFSKVYWPTGPGPNDTGLSRKHIMESCEGSLRRLGLDHLDLYQAHRYDHETPLEETMTAFADLVRSGKVLYIGVSEWSAEQIRAGAALARELRIPFVSNQPQYSLLWRVIDDQVVPASRDEGLSQIVWSPMAQGVLTGKYLPGQPVPAGVPCDRRQGRRRLRPALPARRGAGAGPTGRAAGRRGGCVDGAARGRMGAAQRQRRLGDRRRVAARATRGHRCCGRGDPG